jgi:hypothetical protein
MLKMRCEYKPGLTNARVMRATVLRPRRQNLEYHTSATLTLEQRQFLDNGETRSCVVYREYAYRI